MFCNISLTMYSQGALSASIFAWSKMGRISLILRKVGLYSSPQSRTQWASSTTMRFWKNIHVKLKCHIWFSSQSYVQGECKCTCNRQFLIYLNSCIILFRMFRKLLLNDDIQWLKNKNTAWFSKYCL